MIIVQSQKKCKKLICIGLVTLAVFLPFWTYLSSQSAMATCIFCDIISGKSPTKIEFETDDYVIFKDIKPASDHHYLAVPKKHIESLVALTKDDIEIVNTLENGMRKFLVTKGIENKEALLGFHVPPFITVKHLHLHGIAPRSNMSFLMRFIFKPHSAWFKLVDEAKEYLQNKL
uniref:Adenosine 5'-monophosphoramidase HINT3 n=1 Tax=Glossina brevipalpis TaxID=37001 RepID=A0A1A9WLE0_9MUSC